MAAERLDAARLGSAASRRLASGGEPEQAPFLDEPTAAWRVEIGAIPGLLALTIQQPGFRPAGIPIEVRLVSEGPDARHPAAAGQASRDRLRAILISSSTTIAGLLPLLAETSTLLVVLVIPPLSVLLDDWGLARRPNPTR